MPETELPDVRHNDHLGFLIGTILAMYTFDEVFMTYRSVTFHEIAYHSGGYVDYLSHNVKKKYFRTCAPSEDSNPPPHSHSH